MYQIAGFITKKIKEIYKKIKDFFLKKPAIIELETVLIIKFY